MFKRLFAVLMLLPVLAFAEDFVAGKDYEVINGGGATNTTKVTVLEFFNYGCHWCAQVEPALHKWVEEQNGKIDFTRVPVVFNKEWIYFAKAYYTANLLGLNAKMDPLLFKAIQVDKQKLNDNEAMINFFVAQGVDKDTAESAFKNSTTMDLKLSEGSALMARYHINAVPAFIINNTYKTDLQMAQGEERLLKVLDYLVHKSAVN